MAIQQWTIIKLVGPAATDAVSRFDHWWTARRSRDLSCFAPADWHPSVRRAVTNYLSRLADHRCEMPIIYFSQHIDRWLTAGHLGAHLADAHRRILHGGGELWCYRLPDRGKLVKRNGSTALSAQFPETRWLAQRLVEAVDADKKLWPNATLLLNRQSITASPADDDLTPPLNNE